MVLNGYCVIMTTTDSEAGAETIAQALLEKRLAACVQIHPVKSRYLWQGAVERAQEWALSIKARAADFEEIATTIGAAHTYELPEIVAVPILAGEADYLDWIDQATERGKA
jgi:periplasmic divalent cation tolerance protein